MPQGDIFGRSIKYVKGVGEARARLLAKLGIYTVDDAVNFFPRDYQDRSVLKKITEIQDGEECAVRASLVSDANKAPKEHLNH